MEGGSGGLARQEGADGYTFVAVALIIDMVCMTG